MTNRHSMADFYGKYVHTHIFSDYDSARKKYQARIKRELNSVGVELEDLRDKVILDVGTGAQSIAFSDLGAKHVHHHDINKMQVNALISYAEANNVTNISSRCVDITDASCEFPEFDYAVIIGVYHHLENPIALLDNLLKSAKVGAKIFIRCYRSGTWSRWLVSRLRELSELTDAEEVARVFEAVYPLDDNVQFVSDMLDDLFVPVWGAFNPSQLISLSSQLGLRSFTPDDLFDVNFSADDENFRIMLENTKIYEGGLTSKAMTPLAPIDQFKLSVEPQNIESFEVIWRQFSNELKLKNKSEVALRLITLYRLVRKMKHLNYFSLSEYRHVDTGPIDNFGRMRMNSLRNILSKWLN